MGNKDLRVTTVTVGNQLEDQRSLTRSSPLLSEFTSLVDSENVHSVGLDTRDLVSSGEEAGVLRGPLGRGTHTVLVVLTHEDTRQVPELGLYLKNG
jgi:hypothetical protein